MSVAEPFCLGHADPPPARRHRARVRRRRSSATASARSTPRRARVTTGSGETIAYDSLLIAVGARPEPAYRHAITFGADGAPEALSGLLSDLEDGYAKRVAFVVPSTVAWSLPLYELAVMTARDVWSAGIDGVELVFVTPEARPLEASAPRPPAMVARAARRGGHRVHRLHVRGRRPRLRAGGRPPHRRRPHARAAGSRPARRSPACPPIPRASSRSTSTVAYRASRTSTRPATPPPPRSSRAVSRPSRPSRRPRRSSRATAPTSTRSRSGRSCAGCS